MRNACKVCEADNRDAIEAVGLQALKGDISWRAAGREVDWTNYASIKNHMETHYIQEELRSVEDEMDAAVQESIAELYLAMRTAPAEVKPLYAAAIRNMQGLKDTKPSQQNLITALKTIQEMTGMKQEQRMMLLFAEKMFGEVPAPAAPAALENVIDVEASELDESAFAVRGGEK